MTTPRIVTLVRVAALALAFLAGAPALAQFEGVVEMKMSSPQANGTMKAWVSKVGSRTEMDMHAEEMKKQGMGSSMRMVTLMKFADPDVVVFVNDNAKTYSIMNMKEMRERAKGMKHEEETYTVEKLGKDTVAGFACQNAVVTSSKGTRMELCVSTDILGGGSLYRSLERSGRHSNDGFLKALKDAGLEGYPIRMVTKSKEGSMTLELVSAKKQSVPASTFEVPAGYQKSDMFLPMSNPEMDRKMKEALEKMTPEQRKMYEQMMKQRSGGS